jgi:uncharacterized protein
VWDTLHKFDTPSSPTDIDFIYFDASNLTPEREAELQKKLAIALPNFPWEVTNQAAVHLWYEQTYGQAVDPLTSLEEGVASWPEYATVIGIALLEDDSIRVIAPHGLHDLFAGIVRHNPTRASISVYCERLAQKQFSERWPNLQIVIGETGV